MRTNDNGKLLSNFISLGIVQGTNFLLPLLVMPYVISRIGTAGFGIVAVAQVVMIYLSSISDYGFNLTATRDIAISGSDQLKMSGIFFTVLFTKMILCAGLFVLMFITMVAIPAFRSLLTLYVPGFVYVIGQAMFVNWFFQGREKMHYITLSTLASRIVFVVLVYLFIRSKDDATYFVFFLGIGNSIAGIISIILAIYYFKLSFIRPTWNDIRHELKAGWQVTLSNISVNTYMYSGIFILRIFTNNSTVGYYSIAERIFFAARQVLSVYSQVIYPGICRVSREGRWAARLFFRKFYIPFLILTGAGCAILFIFSPQVINVFIKTEPALAVSLLRMLSFVPLVVCLNIPAYQLLLSFDRKKSYFKILLSATILNILLNLLLAKTLGATGTALAIIITEIFITTGLNHELNKNKLAGYVRQVHHE